MDSTRALLERLDTDKNLRRICGWESKSLIPGESTFSRAFEEFAGSGLPNKVHDALIRETLREEIIFHNSRDSTAIDGWQKPESKKPRLLISRVPLRTLLRKKRKKADLKKKKTSS